ncbi:MAG: Hpt domain-containing protein, partial [Archaeoglobaceae archaeon]|nr:Hpt domain-containing protein [Archaeoglobaceae archaeon]MDW8128389.1 Hpt domain-containing protein [Archaeoglobaceae archaeon]
MNNYKSDFLQEAREYVESMNQSFLRLEKGEKEAIDEIFRAMHTIKGMAGFMGYKNLESLCHKLESFLGNLKGKEISEEIVDLLLLSSDRISEILNKIEAEDIDELECNEIYERIELFEDKEIIKEGSKANRDPKDANLKIEVKICEDCAMKGVRGLLILEALRGVCELKATEPEENKIEEGCDYFVIFANGDPKKVDEVLSGIAEIEKYSINEILNKKEEEKKEKEGEKSLTLQNKKSESVRVDVKVLDSIMNLIGELVIIKGRLLQISGKYEIPELSEAINIMEKSITSLQDEVMKVRMVKVERVFNKFPRMVRDLARKFGKKIEFVMEGLDTELDRSVLDEMSDPIMHLLRNAVDHGIETPEERKAKG